VTTPLLTVFDSGRPIGFILDRGVSGYESFDANEISLGLFETQHRAATALRGDGFDRRLAHNGINAPV
jgi:hypothetical protein